MHQLCIRIPRVRRDRHIGFKRLIRRCRRVIIIREIIDHFLKANGTARRQLPAVNRGPQETIGRRVDVHRECGHRCFRNRCRKVSLIFFKSVTALKFAHHIAVIIAQDIFRGRDENLLSNSGDRSFNCTRRRFNDSARFLFCYRRYRSFYSLCRCGDGSVWIISWRDCYQLRGSLLHDNRFYNCFINWWSLHILD